MSKTQRSTIETIGRSGLSGRPVSMLAALLLVILNSPLFAGAAWAQAPNTSDMIKEQLAKIPTGEEGVEQIFAPMAARLELTDEQKQEIKPIVAEMVDEFEAARGKYEAGEYTVMKMMMELNMKGEQAAAKIEPMLGEKQLAEYEAMRAEQKREAQLQRQRAMREMMKARQEAAAAAAETP